MSTALERTCVTPGSVAEMPKFHRYGWPRPVPTLAAGQIRGVAVVAG